MIDQIIAFNKTFVAQKGYEKYLTDKYPDKKLAVLSCMDTPRLPSARPSRPSAPTRSFQRTSW